MYEGGCEDCCVREDVKVVYEAGYESWHEGGYEKRNNFPNTMIRLVRRRALLAHPFLPVAPSVLPSFLATLPSLLSLSFTSHLALLSLLPNPRFFVFTYHACFTLFPVRSLSFSPSFQPFLNSVLHYFTSHFTLLSRLVPPILSPVLFLPCLTFSPALFPSISPPSLSFLQSLISTHS